MSLILLVLIILYHAYMFWQREIKFYSQPKYEPHPDKDVYYSPVEGRVVYVNNISISGEESKSFMTKSGRRLPVPSCLGEGDYLHIGIFMNPMNNHHMVTMTESQEILKTEDHFDKLESMFSTYDFLNIFKWWSNWLEKKADGFIALNKRTVFITNNPDISYCMIYDKFVNKLDNLYDNNVSGRKVIGFVHRGSQCDMFFKNFDDSKSLVKVGEKVSFNTELVLK